MTEYLVTWKIVVDGSSPKNAVLFARECLEDPETTAVLFEVTDPDGKTVIIDLSEKDDLKDMIGTYEWCVMYKGDTTKIHRGPWSEEACKSWIKEAVEEDKFPPDIFYVAKRWCGDWVADESAH